MTTLFIVMFSVQSAELYTRIVEVLFNQRAVTYLTLQLNLALIIIVSSVLALVTFLTSLSVTQDTEKRSEYESGFAPFDSATRLPFDVHFYLVGILFLLFDVEITLLLPYINALHAMNWYEFYNVSFFVAILTAGYTYEWKRGALSWSAHLAAPFIRKAAASWLPFPLILLNPILIFATILPSICSIAATVLQFVIKLVYTTFFALPTWLSLYFLTSYCLIDSDLLAYPELLMLWLPRTHYKRQAPLRVLSVTVKEGPRTGLWPRRVVGVLRRAFRAPFRLRSLTRWLRGRRLYELRMRRGLLRRWRKAYSRRTIFLKLPRTFRRAVSATRAPYPLKEKGFPKRRKRRRGSRLFWWGFFRRLRRQKFRWRVRRVYRVTFRVRRGGAFPRRRRRAFWSINHLLKGRWRTAKKWKHRRIVHNRRVIQAGRPENIIEGQHFPRRFRAAFAYKLSYSEGLAICSRGVRFTILLFFALTLPGVVVYVALEEVTPLINDFLNLYYTAERFFFKLPVAEEYKPLLIIPTILSLFPWALYNIVANEFLIYITCVVLVGRIYFLLYMDKDVILHEMYRLILRLARVEIAKELRRDIIARSPHPEKGVIDESDLVANPPADANWAASQTFIDAFMNKRYLDLLDDMGPDLYYNETSPEERLLWTHWRRHIMRTPSKRWSRLYSAYDKIKIWRKTTSKPLGKKIVRDWNKEKILFVGGWQQPEVTLSRAGVRVCVFSATALSRLSRAGRIGFLADEPWARQRRYARRWQRVRLPRWVHKNTYTLRTLGRPRARLRRTWNMISRNDEVRLPALTYGMLTLRWHKKWALRPRSITRLQVRSKHRRRRLLPRRRLRKRLPRCLWRLRWQERRGQMEDADTYYETYSAYYAWFYPADVGGGSSIDRGVPGQTSLGVNGWEYLPVSPCQPKIAAATIWESAVLDGQGWDSCTLEATTFTWGTLEIWGLLRPEAMLEWYLNAFVTTSGTPTVPFAVRTAVHEDLEALTGGIAPTHDAMGKLEDKENYNQGEFYLLVCHHFLFLQDLVVRREHVLTLVNLPEVALEFKQITDCAEQFEHSTGAEDTAPLLLLIDNITAGPGASEDNSIADITRAGVLAPPQAPCFSSYTVLFTTKKLRPTRINLNTLALSWVPGCTAADSRIVALRPVHLNLLLTERVAYRTKLSVRRWNRRYLDKRTRRRKKFRRRYARYRYPKKWPFRLGYSRVPWRYHWNLAYDKSELYTVENWTLQLRKREIWRNRRGQVADQCSGGWRATLPPEVASDVDELLPYPRRRNRLRLRPRYYFMPLWRRVKWGLKRLPRSIWNRLTQGPAPAPKPKTKRVRRKKAPKPKTKRVRRKKAPKPKTASPESAPVKE